ncbi:MAG: hypothetical protein QNJ94_22475 [Alphaproteobacteria bacterium]|nr:hypothetical protein [Alphaproteobacteria bacterium]
MSQNNALRLLRAVLTVLALTTSPSAFALCLSQDMQGRWINVDGEGQLKRIELAFACCDQVHCSPGQGCFPVCAPEENTVRVYGPCGPNDCDWGQAVPHYLFLDTAAGSQYTRVDARFFSNGETKELVILRLGKDELLVFWSVIFPGGSQDRNFSLVEYFERQHCFTYRGRILCRQKRKMWLQ